MWKCGSVKICKYENMEMPSGTVAAGGYDTSGKYARKFNRFVNEKLKFTLLNVFAFADYLKPNPRLGEFFHRNLYLMDEVFARFGFGCLGIVGGDARCGTENLVCKTAAADSFDRQRNADFYAARGKLDDSILKISFHTRSFPYFHNSIFSQFHNSTFLKEAA